MSDIWNGIFDSNRILFTIEVTRESGECNLHTSHGGTFEVDKGTTWREFFSTNFSDDRFGWGYDRNTLEV